MTAGIAQELAHQVGLLPLIVMLIWGRRLPAAYWLVAAALALSWLVDSVTMYAGGTWALDYFWLPVQFGLIVAAFTAGPARVLWLSGLVVVAVVSAAVTAPGPDWLLVLAGSVAVLALARGPLAIPLRILYGAGTLAYLAMIATWPDVALAWWAYQSVRVVAHLAFGAVVVWSWSQERSWAAS